jgi:murein DD-endopeptidase MepM/ murein hydrolase activator NlpD
MSSPRCIEGGAPLSARTLVAVIAAALILASLFAAPVRAAGPEEVPKELKEAKKELRATKDKIRAGRHKLRRLQREMNDLATSIARTEDRLDHAHERILKLQRKVAELETEAAALQDELDDRNREAYMMGTAPVMYVLTASSAAEAAARLGFLDEMNRRDEILALELAVATGRIAMARTAEARAWQVIEIGRLRLVADRKALRKKMERFRHLIAELNIRVEEIQREISMMRPFALCPMGGPYAIADNFGAPRHEPGGGFHLHQGDDIMAAKGTPILAPFDGVASISHSQLGGLGVYVHGEFGYVYNAHLSRLGTLGPVETGDVVGYVGSTGHSSGPHNHFEWHPENGDAVDPYEFLLMVCEGAPLDPTG